MLGPVGSLAPSKPLPGPAAPRRAVGEVALLVGYRSRPAAVIAWFSHTALMTSGYLTTYGVDSFAHIGLFYCV